MLDIVLGRKPSDVRKYGTRGAILLGKHYVKMGETTALSNPVYMDISAAHAVFICGKRGTGKSYAMGGIAEGLATIDPDIAQNIGIILLDVMGIYWTMKYSNRSDDALLAEWGLSPKPCDIKIYTPYMAYDEYKKKGMPTDVSFSVAVNELTAEDWALTFDIDVNSPMGVLIERGLNELVRLGKPFDIGQIIDKMQKDSKADQLTKDAAENRFLAAEEWGVFKKDGTPLKDLVKGGQVTVLDVSCYATQPNGWKIRSLIIGLVAKKLFLGRMLSRKDEEFSKVSQSESYFSSGEFDQKMKDPMIWLVVDEAHEFLPKEGKVASSDALVTILREGRQPGISLILATQQPGKIHTDVMTQSDIVLSMKLTTKIDIDALSLLMQSYMRSGIDRYFEELPRVPGACVAFDDSNERMFPMRIRPRCTWHGGSSPFALKEKKKMFGE
ncbi:MAG: DUF87 domain-containing protein [Candidatus Woesearchaeota archaeon]|jgi:hypothetical protein